MKRMGIRLRTLLIGALTTLTLAGCQTSMQSEVKGSRKPNTISCSLGERVEVANGGFTILQKCVFPENLIVGDGRGEATLWDFDFSQDKHETDSEERRGERNGGRRAAEDRSTPR